MKTLHIFTEELSAKKVLETILPPILPNDVTLRIYHHQGKKDLEQAVKNTIPTLSRIPGARILITQDQDNADCREVKQQLNELLRDRCHCIYFVRIICRELESWFLGDLQAVQRAYPRFRAEHYINKATFRNVDSIQRPNHYLRKIIPEYAGKEKLPKLEASEKISPFLDIQNNNSESFKQTITAIERLIAS